MKPVNIIEDTIGRFDPEERSRMFREFGIRVKISVEAHPVEDNIDIQTAETRKKIADVDFPV